MAKIKLTKRAIDALPKTDLPRGEKYFDSALTGFGLVVYPSGRKVFFVNYGDRDRRRRMKLGDYGVLTPETARAEAERTLVDIRAGHDPLDHATTQRATPTFKEYIADYLEGVRRRKKRPDQDERYLSSTSSDWGARPLDTISRVDVTTMQKVVAARGHTTANRWLASIRACFASALADGFISANPAMGIKPFRENPPRARVLSDDELEKVLCAIEKEPDLFVRAAFHMLIETGARKSEVLGTRWADIDFDSAQWRIPSPKAGHPQVMPLPQSTVERLHSLTRISEFVFPGRDPACHREDLKSPWKRIRARVGIPDVRIHDVRRTFGLQVARTAGLHVASRLLRHSDIRVTEKVYAPLGLDELREAMENRSGGTPRTTENHRGHHGQ